jgi:MFS family permease
VGTAVVFSSIGSGGWVLTVLVSPMSHELEWTHTQILGALTLTGLLSALVAPLIGRLVDQYGSRRVIPIGLISFGFCLFLTRYMNSLWQFYLLYGVARGLTQNAMSGVSTQVIAANWFLRKRGIAFAALAVGTSTAGIIFVPVAQAIADAWGWRMVWSILGLFLVVVMAPMAWLIIRSRPEDIGLNPDGLSTAPGAVEAEAAAPTAHKSWWRRRQVADVSWTLREAMRTRTFWILNMGLLFASLPAATLYAIMHSYLTEQGLSATTAANLVGLWAFGLLVGTPIWAALAQVVSIRHLLGPNAILMGGAIWFFVAGAGTSVSLIFVALFLVGIGITGFMQVGQQAWADYYGRANLGAIVGVNHLLRVFASAGGPVMAGLVHDATGGYRDVFYVFAASCFIGALALFLAKQPNRVSPG